MTPDDDPPSSPTLFDRPPTASSKPASKLTSRFRTVREIARGGMGRVVEAIDTELGRTVAVKEVLSTHPDARRRFEREIAITARLEHPSIVPLYDAGSSPSGDPFYVMRKLTGAPLDRVIAGATTLDRRLLLLPNLLAVADAVAHAHGRGVLHRDLKPSNVLVGDLGDTVVIDWGLAKIVGEPDDPMSAEQPQPGSSLRTVAGAVIGTPGFMAPEQVTGDSVDARSDVYALGACLYYMLAGEPPISGGSETEILTRTVSGEVGSLAPGVPSELVTIVGKAMARDPRARYLDAGGFSEDLRRFLGGQLVASHRYGWRQQLVRWFRRRRALVIATAIALVVTLTIGVIALRRVFAEQARAEDAAARERDRADDLVVTQAQAYLEHNPTLAITTLAQLRPDSPHWNELTPTLAEARGRGVAVGYPGDGGKVTVIEPSPKPGDAHVLASGNGEVWLHDLAHRTTTRLVDGATVFVRARWCGEHVVVYDRGPMSIYDPRSGHGMPMTWPDQPATFATTPDGVVVISDAHGRIDVADLDATGTTQLALDNIRSVELSPSGAWLTASDGTGHVQLLRRKDRTHWELATTFAPLNLVRYDTSESRLAYVTGATLERDVVEVDLATLAERRRWPKLKVVDLAYAGGSLVAQVGAPAEFRELRDAGQTALRGAYDYMSGWSLTGSGDYMIALEGRRRIAITAGSARFTIAAPLDLSSVVVADHFLVGASPSTVVAWDLTDVLPARTSIPGVARIGLASPTRLLAQSGTPSAVYKLDRYDIELPFRLVPRDPVGTFSISSQWFVLDSGAVAAINMVDRSIDLLDPAIHFTSGPVTQIAARTRDNFVLGTGGGTIMRLGASDKADFAHLGERVISLVLDAGAIGACTAGGTLWRRRADGQAAQVDIGSGGAIALAGDTLYAARDRDVLAWSTGAPIAVAHMPLPITDLHRVAGGRIAVETDGGGLALLDPSTHAVRPVLPALVDLVYAQDGTIAAARFGDAVVVIDLATGDHWPVVDHLDVQPGGIAVSNDAVIVAEHVRDDDRSTIYRFAIRPPADLRSWARTATNASVPTTIRGALEFRRLPAP